MSNAPYSAEAVVPNRHFAVATSDTVDMPVECRVVALTTGDVALVDHFGVALTYVGVPAGWLSPIRARRVNATGTTATLAGTY